MLIRPLPPSRISYKDQVVLRPVEPSDIAGIQKAVKLTIHELKQFMDWAHRDSDEEQFLERILSQRANYFKGEDYELALFDAKTNAFLVYSGFFPSIKINPSSFEIGFWTSAEHKGKGLATLATRMQIALIFEYFKGDRIEITCSLTNQASLRVIEKCGFLYEGKLRNFYPKGTDEMLKDGYVSDRRVALYALIPEDCQNLSWYQEIAENITIHPLLGNPYPLLKK